MGRSGVDVLASGIDEMIELHYGDEVHYVAVKKRFAPKPPRGGSALQPPRCAYCGTLSEAAIRCASCGAPR